MIYLQTLENLVGKEFKKNSVIYYTGEDTVTVLGDEPGTGGLVTEFTGTKEFANTAAASELMNYACIGALLWKANDGKLLVSNGDGQEWDPKSTSVPVPTKDGYTLYGVCVGRGLWAKIGWSGLTTNMKWASSNSDVLYTTCHGINIHGNGWESTQHIRTHKDVNLTGTIWAALETNEYIPSKYELEEIHNNCCDNNHGTDDKDNVEHTFNKNLGKLLSLSTDTYWSSSQYASGSGGYGDAFRVNFSNGFVSYSNKTFGYRSVALLHF